MTTWFSYLKQGLSRDMPDDRLAGRSDYPGIRSLIGNLLPYITPHWCKGILGLLLIITGALLALPPPLITRYLVDDVILRGAASHLIPALLLMAGCLIAEKLTRMLEEFYFARFEQYITLDLQKDLFSRILHSRKSFFDSNRTGYLHSRLSEEVDELRWFFSGTIVHIISNLLRFAGGVIFLFYLEWKLTSAVLVLLPILLWCTNYFSRKIHILSHQALEHKAEAASQLQDSLSGSELIKAFSSEDSTVKRLLSPLAQLIQISIERTTVSSVANMVIQSMPGIARTAALAVGGYWIIIGQWTLGSLLAYQAYLAYVFGPVQFLASVNMQFQKSLAALERIAAMLDIEREDTPQGVQKISRLKGEVEFINVSFSYKGHAPVLKNLNLHIYPGERVAIVGPSGVGKTTLLSLIVQFYRPRSGEILFDGCPALNCELGSLRQRIGYVSQQPQLVAGTILENLWYGNPDAQADQVIRAAKIAGIHDYICSLPAGYETEIGPNGIRLSEGQKQRLAIARALISDPDILVFDEPTAALDGRMENSFLDGLPAALNGKTLFIATHHPTVIKYTDRIFVMNESYLFDIGTHNSLLESSDYYRSLATGNL